MSNPYLYDKDGNKIDFSNFVAINEGMCGKIYRNNDKVLKVYKVECKNAFKISKKVFDLLKQINSPNMIRLYDYLFQYDSRFNKFLSPDAYTMEYIKPDNIDLLMAEREYVLDTVRDLEKLCEILAKHNVRIHDSHYSNIIFNKNGGILIDPDTYTTGFIKSYEAALLNNKKELLYFIKSKLSHDYKNHEDNDNLEYYNLNRLLYHLNIVNNMVTDEIKRLFTEKNLYESLKKNL